MVQPVVPAQCACSLLRVVLMFPCYEYLPQSPLLPTIPPCIIMSRDPPPRRSSRLSNKRTVVSDDGTESAGMTVTKRRGKHTDAGRRHTKTCTFVIGVLRIMYDAVSSHHYNRKDSVQCMCWVVCSAVMAWLCVKYTPCTTCTFENKTGQGIRACWSDTGVDRQTLLKHMWLHEHKSCY